MDTATNSVGGVVGERTGRFLTLAKNRNTLHWSSCLLLNHYSDYAILFVIVLLLSLASFCTLRFC